MNFTADIPEGELKKLLSITHISSVLNSSLDIYQLMSLIMLYSKDLLESEASSLFLLEKSDQFLYCEVALGEKGEIIQQYARLELGQGIAGWVAKEKKSVILEDAYLDSRFDRSWDLRTGFHTKSLICVPLFMKEELIGTLEVMNKSQGKVFDKFDLDLLLTLAEVAAVAIHNSQQQEKLNKKILEISLLYEFEKKITSEKNHKKLGLWVLDRILEYLDAKSGTIYLIDQKSETLYALAARGVPEESLKNLNLKIGEGIAGWVARERKKVLIQNLENDVRYKKDLGFKFESNSLITVPLLTDTDLLGVISINNKKSGYAFNHNDLHMLEAISNQLAIVFQNYFLLQKVRESEKERERAMRVMKEVLPIQIPEMKGLKIATEYKPFDDVGGDFFQFYPISDHQIGVFIADISGHGLSSALLAMVVNTILSTFEKTVYTSPGILLSGLNSFLYNKMAGNFLTGFFACIDTEKNELVYSNAGHPFPFLWENATETIHKLHAKGKLMGIIPHLVFEEKKISFQPQDKLILFTDGLLETSMDENPLRTEEIRFENELFELCKSNTDPHDIIRKAMKSIQNMEGFNGFQDDITFVVLNRE